MNTSKNSYDAIETLIMQEEIKIEALDFHKELDLMLVVLNTKAILRQKISRYQKLEIATIQQLQNYILNASGIGVHWPDLDEDLSLKGFLQDELRSIVKSDSNQITA